MMTRATIRAGEQHLAAHGLSHLVPEFHRAMVRSMYLRRAQTVLAVLVVLAPLAAVIAGL